MEILEDLFRSGEIDTQTELLLFPSVCFVWELAKEDPDFSRILLAGLTAGEFLCGALCSWRDVPAVCVIRNSGGLSRELIILLDIPQS